LNTLYPNEPDHPGIAHYIIHTYDYPELAALALPAARKYAAIAPSSAHATHMPSHIFTRLGLWDECIASNRASVAAAQCYAETAGFKGHWDEELHGLDYLVYALLQKGENRLAREQCEYLTTIHDVYPANFKVAYAFAAIPARYALENKLWKEAATLSLQPVGFRWEKFPWQKAIHHFARLMGAANSGDTGAARGEYRELQQLHEQLINEKDVYKANQVLIQLKTGEAWIAYREGRHVEAYDNMKMAAELEDATEKHPVTPGEVLPARELLGDLLLQMNRPGEALEAYELDLGRHPKRFNGLCGAGLAAKRAGNPEKACRYYGQLLGMVDPGRAERPELAAIRRDYKNGCR
jgi:tetratricopeptide (TPR) repeat protein